MTEPTLSLTLTIEQAAALSRQQDLAARISMCQFGEIEQLARTGEMKHRSGRAINEDECVSLNVWLRMVAGIFGFAPNASFSIGSPHVSEDAHRGWEIRKVIDKALAVHRGVMDIGGLGVRYTTDPVPVAAISGDNDGGGKR